MQVFDLCVLVEGEVYALDTAGYVVLLLTVSSTGSRLRRKLKIAGMVS